MRRGHAHGANNNLPRALILYSVREVLLLSVWSAILKDKSRGLANCCNFLVTITKIYYLQHMAPNQQNKQYNAHQKATLELTISRSVLLKRQLWGSLNPKQCSPKGTLAKEYCVMSHRWPIATCRPQMCSKCTLKRGGKVFSILRSLRKRFTCLQ